MMVGDMYMLSGCELIDTENISLIGTEVLSFADSKAESSSSQHMQDFKEEETLAS
jgi:hypothetical protein